MRLYATLIICVLFLSACESVTHEKELAQIKGELAGKAAELETLRTSCPIVRRSTLSMRP